MDEETFGQRLRRLRQKHNLTLAQLSDAIKVSLKTLQRWEKEERQPRADDLKALATALNVSEDELLNGVPAEQRTWVLHVEIGDRKETFIDMAKLATNPMSTIMTTSEAGFLQLGGSYELWTDDTLFKKMIADFKKLREAVIASGRAQGGIKDEEKKK